MAGGDRLVRTVRCPVCHQLPDLVLSPRQAFCGNDDCRALQFDPSADPAEQIADGTEIESLVRPGGISPQAAAAAAAARPRQVPSSAADDGREIEIRHYFHLHGYRCLPGECTICDTQT